MNGVVDSLTELKASNRILEDSKTLLQSIAIGLNFRSITRQIVNNTSMLFVAGHSFTSRDLQMGMPTNQYRSVTYAGSIELIAEFSDVPEILIQLSNDDINYYSDGTLASFYKETPTLYQFVFQRSDISMRYCRLHVKNQNIINNLLETISMN